MAHHGVPVRAVVLGDVGERPGRAVELVLALAGGAGERVDDAEEQVARDVLEVAAVLEPRPGGRDVVGGALALRLHQHDQPGEVLAVPRRERLEQLEAIARRVDHHGDAGAVRRRCRERVDTGVVATLGQHLAHRRLERHLGPVGRGERVVRRVEVEAAGQRQRHHRVGRGDERQRLGRAVVALGEVAVVRVDDRVRLPGDALGPRPLADARPARVGEHRRTDRLEVGEQAVALDRRPDLLGAGRDQQLGLGGQPLRRRLAGDRRGPGDVLVRRVGARSDQRRGDLERPVVLLARRHPPRARCGGRGRGSAAR